ncbi:MAG: peptidase MA family metallohydrolase [Anaerolineales bacterium]
MHSFLIAALLFFAGSGPQSGYRAESWIEAFPGEMAFNGRLHFTARVHASEPILASRLILAYDSSRYAFFPLKGYAPDGFSLAVEAVTATALPFPFTDVTYWWEVDLPSGNALVSEAQTFFYIDDRFAWNHLPRTNLDLYWVEGDWAAANGIADLALLSIGTISAELETPIPERITVVQYPKMADFHAALDGRIRGWEGAVSSPGAETVILAAAPGAEGRATLAVLLPHEIAHVLLGTRWGAGYALIPQWLREGIAAGYEMEPRPEQEIHLREAAAERSVIPIRTLCRVFPAEENPAMLAYAESKSFVAFLKQKYGLAAIRSALAAYAGGAECDHGLEAVTGRKFSDLESAWLGTFADNGLFISASWALVLAGIVLLAGILVVRGVLHRKNAKRTLERPGDK